MRVFFDTNVLASAFLARGLCSELYEAVALDHHLIIGEPVLEELLRILRDKLQVPAGKIARVRTELRRFELAPASDLEITFEQDPADEPILACALTTKADVFITGDKAILALGSLEIMRICSPRQLWFSLFETKTKH